MGEFSPYRVEGINYNTDGIGQANHRSHPSDA